MTTSLGGVDAGMEASNGFRVGDPAGYRVRDLVGDPVRDPVGSLGDPVGDPAGSLMGGTVCSGNSIGKAAFAGLHMVGAPFFQHERDGQDPPLAGGDSQDPAVATHR